MSSSNESEAVLSASVEGVSSEASLPEAAAGLEAAPTAGSPDAALGSPSAEEVPEANGSVNYDEAGLVEVEVDQVLYRLDAGKQGTALCISTRSGGSWDWRFHGEARWDGRTLRSKAFDRRLLDRLSKELQQAASAE